MTGMDGNGLLVFKPQRGILLGGIAFFGAGVGLFLLEASEVPDTGRANLVRFWWLLLAGVCALFVAMALVRLAVGTIAIGEDGIRFQNGLWRRCRISWPDVEWVELRQRRWSSPSVVFGLTGGVEKRLDLGSYEDKDKAGMLNAIERRIQGGIQEPRKNA